MIIQYASDLHLEFRENRKFILDNPLEPIGQVLVLAGDIVPFAVMDQRDDFFNYVSDHFEQAWWIPGNHEYYHSDVTAKSGFLNEPIRSNVHLVNNITITHGGVRFVFSTLWTHISPAKAFRIQQGMSDFHVIHHQGKAFAAEHYNALHAECLNFVTGELKETRPEPTMVVTHHVPTFQHYPAKYKGSPLDEGFAVELFDLIESSGPQYWLYGHHHCNTPDFVIGQTKMITNQLGYVKYAENQGYSGNKHIIL